MDILVLLSFLGFVVCATIAAIRTFKKRPATTDARTRIMLIISAALVALALVFGSLSEPSLQQSARAEVHPPAVSPSARDTLVTLLQGDTSIVMGDPGIPCFNSSATLDAYDKAQANDDRYGQQDARRSSIVVTSDVHVRAIGTGGFLGATKVKLRLESGDLMAALRPIAGG